MTIGFRISRYGAAEVYIDFTEELRHTETNPTCSIHHFCADEGTIKTVFRTIISVNQLSPFGAVAEMCEECE